MSWVMKEMVEKNTVTLLQMFSTTQWAREALKLDYLLRFYTRIIITQLDHYIFGFSCLRTIYGIIMIYLLALLTVSYIGDLSAGWRKCIFKWDNGRWIETGSSIGLFLAHIFACSHPGNHLADFCHVDVAHIRGMSWIYVHSMLYVQVELDLCHV